MGGFGGEGGRARWEKYREEEEKGSISSSKVPWSGPDDCAWLEVPTAPYCLVHVAQAQGREGGRGQMTGLDADG